MVEQYSTGNQFIDTMIGIAVAIGIICAHQAWRRRYAVKRNAAFASQSTSRPSAQIVEEMERETLAFEARMLQESPHIRDEVLSTIVNGLRITNVGDMAWWPNTKQKILLIAVCYEDGSCGTVGYMNGEIRATGNKRHSWSVAGMLCPPRIEFEDGDMLVWLTQGTHLITQLKEDPTNNARWWEYCGHGG